MPYKVNVPTLEPCPHCGTDTGEIRYGASGYTSPYYYPYERGFVECRKCRCGTSKRYHTKDAVDDWNRRPK